MEKDEGPLKALKREIAQLRGFVGQEAQDRLAQRQLLIAVALELARRGGDALAVCHRLREHALAALPAADAHPTHQPAREALEKMLDQIEAAAMVRGD